MGVDTRTVELEVQAARLRGIPIVSDSDGYRFAQNSAEAFECYRWLRSKYLSQARTAFAIKRAAFRMAATEQDQGVLWTEVA